MYFKSEPYFLLLSCASRQGLTEYNTEFFVIDPLVGVRAQAAKVTQHKFHNIFLISLFNHQDSILSCESDMTYFFMCESFSTPDDHVSS